MHRMTWMAIGIVLALVVGLYAARGHLTPGGAFLGSTAIAAGISLPFITPSAEATPARAARKRMQKIEVLGLLIFILMAVIMLTVGAALFFDWLAEPGTASAGMQVELGLFPGVPGAAGAISIMDLVVGVEVIGGLSLVALYMLSSFRGGA